MAQHKSAEKRSRQSTVKRSVNRELKSEVKTALKKARTETDKEKATAAVKKAFSTLDRLSSKGVIHKNKAANQKRRLARHLNKLGNPPAEKA